MVEWKKSVRSGVTDEFVHPFPPVKGEPTEVSVQISSEAPVIAVVCHTIQDGKSHYYPMERTKEGPFHKYQTTIFPAYESRWYFSFQIETEDGWFFAQRNGVQGFHPSLSSLYCVDTSLVLDDWVPGSTFYQIFPDRFRNGNPDIGVQTGEYRFDDRETVALHPDTIPPSYETAHCLDFYNGDLKGIAQSIDYFKQLGITALYLNPIGRAKTNHRYDCTDFFHVDEHLGGDEALIELSERLHDAGIRLMLDISINHCGVEHPWFTRALESADSESASYFYRDEHGEFVYWWDVKTLPQLNYGNPEVRTIMYRGEQSVLRKFLKKPFSIDAWRFDVGADTGRHEHDQLSHEIWKEVRSVVKEENPQAYILGEHWEDASAYVQGDQWDSAMNYFGSGRLLRRWCGQRDTYLMTEWGHSDETGRQLTGVELSEAIQQHLASIPDQLVPRQFNLIDSHDTMRFHNHERVFSWSLYEGIVMLLFVMPGVPSIYYGDEIGLAGTIESNEGARYPMQWNRDRWDMRFYTLYSRLGNLRKRHELFAQGDWDTEWADETTVVFSRVYRSRGLIMILNRGESERILELDMRHRHIAYVEEWESGTRVALSEGIISWHMNPQKSALLLFSVLN